MNIMISLMIYIGIRNCSMIKFNLIYVIPTKRQRINITRPNIMWWLALSLKQFFTIIVKLKKSLIENNNS